MLDDVFSGLRLGCVLIVFRFEGVLSGLSEFDGLVPLDTPAVVCDCMGRPCLGS